MPTNAVFEKLKSEGILLAIIPFIGSLTAFAFETGYLTYFDIPNDVISLSLYRIIAAALWLSFAIAIIWICAARVIAIALSPNNEIKNFMLLTLSIMLITLFIWKIELKREMLFALIGVSVSLVLSAISWSMSEQGPLGKKLPPKFAKAVKDGELIATNAARISDIFIGPFALSVFVLLLVGVVGYWTAKINERAWVLDDQPTFFLVRKYDEAYVFKEYDPKTMIIANRVQVISLSDAKTMTLKQVLLPGLTTKFGSHRANDMSDKVEPKSTTTTLPKGSGTSPEKAAPKGGNAL